MNDEFYEIPGHNGRYFINRSGVIFSKAVRYGINPKKWHRIVLAKDRCGYLKAGLRESPDAPERNNGVHRLVAMTFLPNPENKPCVNHKDGNKANNSVENLEWVTYQENSVHSFSNGLQICQIGQDHHNAKVNEDQVREIRRRRASGELLSSIAPDFGVTPTLISYIANRKTWKHVA